MNRREPCRATRSKSPFGGTFSGRRYAQSSSRECVFASPTVGSPHARSKHGLDFLTKWGPTLPGSSRVSVHAEFRHRSKPLRWGLIVQTVEIYVRLLQNRMLTPNSGARLGEWSVQSPSYVQVRPRG